MAKVKFISRKADNSISNIVSTATPLIYFSSAKHTPQFFIQTDLKFVVNTS